MGDSSRNLIMDIITTSRNWRLAFCGAILSTPCRTPSLRRSLNFLKSMLQNYNLRLSGKSGLVSVKMLWPFYSLW